jgi:guanosine-3',5'-bis(diphosphate) 3'-pyrophosphohydrolase
MSTLERAIAIAVEAHAGQTDKGGAPYILHPLRVMMRVEGDDVRIAAVLHDLVEDTEWTLEALRAEGFDGSVVDAIDGLTRRDGEAYLDFCRRAAANEIARAVKLADLEDNLDPARVAALPEANHSLADRYRKARAILLEEPGSSLNED